MTRLVVHVENIPIWNCTEYFPEGFSPPISPYDMDIRGIDNEDDCFGKLPKGDYLVEKLTDADGGIWYVLNGTSWGAYVETWDMDVNAGYISIIETPGRMSFEEFVSVHYNREIREYVGKRTLVICLDDRRIAERSYATSNGECLGDRTLGYLPVSANVDGKYIVLS